jgi:protein O-GlcNAc transferase
MLKASRIERPNYSYDKLLNTNSFFKIKIGYVSADFIEHPLAQLLTSLFGMHDRSKFYVVGFSLRKSDGSEWRQKIEASCDEFIDVYEGMSPSALADLIHSKNIHILFNLNGYTGGARNDAFSLRPAPI